MVDIQTIKIPWCEPEIVELRHRRIVLPLTPPNMSPGVEYLEDSPFQGRKEIEEGPYDTPENTTGSKAFTIPMRNVEFPWSDGVPGVPGVPGEGYKQPTKAVSIQVTPYPGTSWVVTEVPFGENGAISITLDTLESEDLGSNLWVLCSGTSDYPSYSEWYLSRNSSCINMVEMDRMQKFNKYTGAPWIPTSEEDEDTPTLLLLYEVVLYRDVQDVSYQNGGPSGWDGAWYPWPVPAYDVRAAFALKVQNSDSSFFRKFRECLAASSGLAQAYSALMGRTNAYWGAGAKLIFYEALGEATEPPPPIVSETIIPIDGKINMKIKMKAKSTDYSCSSGIYRSWEGEPY